VIPAIRLAAVGLGGSLVAGAIALASCGGDDTETSTSALAGLVPPDAPVYAEAVVDPEGDLRSDVSSTLGDLLGEDDVGARIVEQIDDLFANEEIDASWSEDVEPWLGEHAGVFFSDFDAEPNGAAIFETTDETAAREALEKLDATEGTPKDASYRGIEYSVSTKNSASAIVDGYAVSGSEAGLKAVIDASQGESLADVDEYTELTDLGPGNGLFTAYADPARVVDGLADSGEITEGDRAAIRANAGDLLDAPVLAAGGVDGSTVFVEVTAPAANQIDGEDTDLLDRVPDDAWIAFAIPSLGDVLDPATVATPEASGTLDEFEATTGVDPETLLDAVGGAAGYFRGTSVLGIGGALILDATDEAALTDVLGRVAASLSADPAVDVERGDTEGEAFSVSPADVPIEFPFVLRDDLLVAGLGQESVDQVYDPQSSLTDAESYDTARDILGDDFSVNGLLAFEPMLELLSSIPDVQADPEFAPALPYLQRLNQLAIGARGDEDWQTVRFALDVLETEDGG
jgi:hypothetical protein